MHIDDINNSVMKPKAVALIQQARGECKWLYIPHVKVWFSPNELEETFGWVLLYNRVLLYNSDCINRLQLHDPIEAIFEGWERVNRMQSEVIELQSNGQSLPGR